ncbi:MAG TPA: hypothetical protein VKE40_19870 [Gemmataceae bacterium]|nr:hypothetical protein [Gemmataceae bacterium]
METTRVKSTGGSPIPRRVALLVLVVAVAGCEDQPTTKPNRPNNFAVVPTPLPGSNEAPQRPFPVDPYYVVPPIIKSFDGEVVAKEPDRFWVRGQSGRHYLLLPTHHLTNKPPHEWAFINYDQIEVGQKLVVRLSAKLPLLSAYTCEAVEWRGARLPDGRTLLGDPLKDD